MALRFQALQVLQDAALPYLISFRSFPLVSPLGFLLEWDLLAMEPITVTLMRISFHALSLLSFIQLVTADCYFLNGTLNPDLETQPCNRYQDSTCCSNNKTTVGQTFPVANDVCNPNGLCQNWQTQGDTTYVTWWRGGCSDPTWNSPYCLKNICSDQVNITFPSTIVFKIIANMKGGQA